APVSSHLAVNQGSGRGRRQPANVLKIFAGLGQRARPMANAGVKFVILRIRIGIDQVAFATLESESAVAPSPTRDHFRRRPLDAAKSLFDRETYRSFLKLILPILDGDRRVAGHDAYKNRRSFPIRLTWRSYASATAGVGIDRRNPEKQDGRKENKLRKMPHLILLPAYPPPGGA